jgi:nitrogen fixation/metabolism regulation signal transduction histidine kinase
MGFDRFRLGVGLRVGFLLITIIALAWMLARTSWYLSATLLTALALGQTMLLVQFTTRWSREAARFLEAVSFGDNSANFGGLARDRSFGDLGLAMNQVMERLRTSRAEREEQAQYLQALINHIPVALIAIEDNVSVQLMNFAARRLFEAPCTKFAEFLRYGPEFAAGLEHLGPGEGIILRMERRNGPLQLKAAATDLFLGGRRRRLISLQNIESELTAHELIAWQTVIRVMAHEVMNSLAPVTSLAGTAHELVNGVHLRLPDSDPNKSVLADADDALETMKRRSEGLLHFVQSHRRLTKRIVARRETVPVGRLFARLERLLAGELETRGVRLAVSVKPQDLDIQADIELLDQALINLVRNSIEALGDKSGGVISLSAYSDSEGKTVLAVGDNGPGIPSDQREKVFVPFFTTKRMGSGVGLTLVRQIVSVHGGQVVISDAEGGGAVVSMKF